MGDLQLLVAIYGVIFQVYADKVHTDLLGSIAPFDLSTYVLCIIRGSGKRA